MTQSSDTSQLIALRRQKLVEWRAGGSAFPNDFRRTDTAGLLHREWDERSAEAIEAEQRHVAVAGRMVSKRVMGKASFAHIEDGSDRIQLFVSRDDLGVEPYAEFKRWDVGDIVAAEGFLFKTRTGELSVKSERLRLLVKTLRPLPEKFHGLADQEQRYRQRYLDLIVNAETRRTMLRRTAIVSAVRRFFDRRGFVEVETPMMHSIPGGAAARPFSTYHNALETELYLRIAPELFLKRLVVGGFEKVYELNRNFRNEGVSTRHNPEFTMLEFYQAYADYEDAMSLTEELIRTLAAEILETETLVYQGRSYDLSGPFQRITLKKAILTHNAASIEDIENVDRARKLAGRLGVSTLPDWGIGKVLLQIFEKTVEHKLEQPTFVTEYPLEVSPLARRKDADPEVTERFEFFIAGREIANGFSELNDFEEQSERFRQQVERREAGDDEAMVYDADYIRAMEYGLPPTAGEGIGIDRLVMLFTDSASIRDVLLFPYLRREST